MRTLAAIGLLWLLTRLAPSVCGNRRWLPFEDDEGFRYERFRCSLRFGHAGDHYGTFASLSDGSDR